MKVKQNYVNVRCHRTHRIFVQSSLFSKGEGKLISTKYQKKMIQMCMLIRGMGLLGFFFNRNKQNYKYYLSICPETIILEK